MSVTYCIACYNQLSWQAVAIERSQKQEKKTGKREKEKRKERASGSLGSDDRGVGVRASRILSKTDVALARTHTHSLKKKTLKTAYGSPQTLHSSQKNTSQIRPRPDSSKNVRMKEGRKNNSARRTFIPVVTSCRSK